MPILQEVKSSQASSCRTKGRMGLMYISVAVAATLILLAAALSVNWKQIGRKLTSLSGYALYVEGPARQVATIGDVIELRAKLTAIGPQDVGVVGARLPCGCLEINPMPVQIPAGEMKEVVILFDTSDRQASEFKVDIDLLLGVPSPQVKIPMHVTLVDGGLREKD